MQEVVRKSALAATRVIAISQATADDIAELYGVPRERIVITPLAPDPRFSAGAGRGGTQVAARYGLRSPYLSSSWARPTRGRTSRGCSMPWLSSVRREGVTLAIASAQGRRGSRGCWPGRASSAWRIGCASPWPACRMRRCRRSTRRPDAGAPGAVRGLRAHAGGGDGVRSPVITANRSSMLEVAGDAALWSIRRSRARSPMPSGAS